MPRARLSRQGKRGSNDLSASAYRTQFIFEFSKDFNGLQAIQRAGYKGAYPGQTASELLQEPEVRRKIEQVVAARADRLQVQGDDIARHWLTIATADARDLCPVMVSCCRYCHGIDFQKQYTLNEARSRQRNHLIAQQKKAMHLRVEYDEEGGDDYDFTKKPNPDCPECHGVGVSTSVPVDVTKLSDQAAMLFDGYKLFKDGTVEIKLRDRDRAMENLTTMLGLDRKRRIAEFNPDDMTEEELDAVLDKAIKRKRLRIDKKEVIDQET